MNTLPSLTTQGFDLSALPVYNPQPGAAFVENPNLFFQGLRQGNQAVGEIAAQPLELQGVQNRNKLDRITIDETPLREDAMKQRSQLNALAIQQAQQEVRAEQSLDDWVHATNSMLASGVKEDELSPAQKVFRTMVEELPMPITSGKQLKQLWAELPQMEERRVSAMREQAQMQILQQQLATAMQNRDLASQYGGVPPALGRFHVQPGTDTATGQPIFINVDSATGKSAPIQGYSPLPRQTPESASLLQLGIRAGEAGVDIKAFKDEETGEYDMVGLLEAILAGERAHKTATASKSAIEIVMEKLLTYPTVINPSGNNTNQPVAPTPASTPNVAPVTRYGL